MNVIKTIPGLSVIANTLFQARKYIKPIDEAKASGDVEKERAAILEACQFWATKITTDLDIKVNVINPENLPKDGPAVFICNHQSYADILVFLYAIKNHQVSFIAKDTLGKIPIFGPWIERIRGILIHRGDARASLATINEGAEYLKQGFSLVIFPEGTRSQSSEMADFKAGSFKLATKARVPIVPVSIEGGYKTFEEPGYIKGHVTIDFMVHPPVITEGVSRAELAKIPEQVEETIRQGVKNLTAK